MSFEDRDAYDFNVANFGRGMVHSRVEAEPLVVNGVCDQKGESLGDIREIVLDLQSGSVGYVVLSFGGFRGAREKLFAVPWKALTLDAKNRRFVLNAAKDAVPLIPDHGQRSLARIESAVAIQLDGL